MQSRAAGQLSPAWTIYLPVLSAAGIIGFNLLAPHEMYIGIMEGELGAIEIAQTLVMITAAFVAINLFVRARIMRFWPALAAVCSFYVAGEEISWGQHFFLWETPEAWKGANDQGETNLHNTSSWFDQKPRLVLELGMWLCALLPYMQRLPQWLGRFAPLIPPPGFIWIALVAESARLSDALQTMGLPTPYHRASEVHELYLYLFVLLYLISLRPQLAPAPRAAVLSGEAEQRQT